MELWEALRRRKSVRSYSQEPVPREVLDRVLASVLMRGLVRDGRLVRLLVALPDVSGSLAKVATLIGQRIEPTLALSICTIVIAVLVAVPLVAGLPLLGLAVAGAGGVEHVGGEVVSVGAAAAVEPVRERLVDLRRAGVRPVRVDDLAALAGAGGQRRGDLLGEVGRQRERRRGGLRGRERGGELGGGDRLGAPLRLDVLATAPVGLWDDDRHPPSVAVIAGRCDRRQVRDRQMPASVAASDPPRHRAPGCGRSSDADNV